MTVLALDLPAEELYIKVYIGSRGATFEHRHVRDRGLSAEGIPSFTLDSVESVDSFVMLLAEVRRRILQNQREAEEARLRNVEE